MPFAFFCRSSGLASPSTLAVTFCALGASKRRVTLRSGCTSGEMTGTVEVVGATPVAAGAVEGAAVCAINTGVTTSDARRAREARMADKCSKTAAQQARNMVGRSKGGQSRPLMLRRSGVRKD